MSRQLDIIDKRILDELQINGRLSIVELANRVNLTKTPCSERVKRLEKSGVIEYYRAVLNTDLIEMKQVTIVHITLNQTSDNALEQFNKAVTAIPEIESCMLIAGQFDYVLKVRTRDIVHFREILGECIGKLPGVRQSNSFAVMETVKESQFIQMAPKTR
ncbi:MAG: Lrp/AsnC ligand binding domain-containing protein [Proteobacteria bacterium]|nr:Lrp/AsnC ligand binding domain-containing protein [Pseudomonadota bacterium]